MAPRQRRIIHPITYTGTVFLRIDRQGRVVESVDGGFSLAGRVLGGEFVEAPTGGLGSGLQMIKRPHVNISRPEGRLAA